MAVNLNWKSRLNWLLEEVLGGRWFFRNKIPYISDGYEQETSGTLH